MTIKEIVENAIIETYDKFEKEYGKGREQVTAAVMQYIEDNKIMGFTNNNNARDNLKKYVTSKRMLIEMARKYVEKVSQERQDNRIRPLNYAVRETLNKYMEKSNSSEYAYRVTIDAIIDYIEKNENHFTRDNNARLVLAERYNQADALKEVIVSSIEGIILEHKKEQVSKYTVDNLQFYPETIKKCAPQILSGKTTFANVQDSRILSSETGKKGELAVSSSIGLKRKGQEDAALIIVHPKNPDFKLLVVADGMGGYEQGEDASNFTVNYIKEWFEKDDTLKYYANTTQEWAGDIQTRLQYISDQISQRYSKAGTTFTAAMVGKDKTMITNIGDSRAYIISGRSVRQVTEDHSLCYRMLRNGEIIQKDDIRFHKNSNKILKGLGYTGDSSGIVRPDYYELDNRSYDILLLTSDGVTDCISDPRLMKIAIEGRTSKEIAQTIVEAALDRNNPDLTARLGIYDNENYVKKISPGKDNTTAVVYKKDKGAER